MDSFTDCVDHDSFSDGLGEPVPEPTVNWELKKKLADVHIPTSEQKIAVSDGETLRAKDLATQLTEFYMVHNGEMVHRVPALVEQYKDRLHELNEALEKRYKCNLATFRAVTPTVADDEEEYHVDESHQGSAREAAELVYPVVALKTDSESNSADVPVVALEMAREIEAPIMGQTDEMIDGKLADAIKIAKDMGITMDVSTLKEALKKHNENLDNVFAELLG